MQVYVHGSMLIEDYGERLVAAEVTAVHDQSADLMIVEDGAVYLDWRGKLYDQYETEIPLEQVKRDLELEQAAKDPTARIAALEAEIAAYDAAYAQGVQEA